MSSPFLAEIRIFPFNYAPRSWAFCNGQIMTIAQNSALFALIGAYYGGNGSSNFALPNLQGAIPVQQGTGPGLSQYNLGQTGGTTTVTLTSQQMAAHNHSESAGVTSAPATATTPSGNLLLQAGLRGGNQFFGSDATTATMATGALGLIGGSQPHNNMPAYLALSYCICLAGVFPTRS